MHIIKGSRQHVFRGEPASSWLERPFTPTLSSSDGTTTPTRSANLSLAKGSSPRLGCGYVDFNNALAGAFNLADVTGLVTHYARGTWLPTNYSQL